MEREDDFREWLIKETKYSGRSTSDVISRCKRVEKILNVNLAHTLRSEKEFHIISKALWDKSDSYLRPGANKTGSVKILVAALRIYRKFRGY